MRNGCQEIAPGSRFHIAIRLHAASGHFMSRSFTSLFTSYCHGKPLPAGGLRRCLKCCSCSVCCVCSLPCICASVSFFFFMQASSTVYTLFPSMTNFPIMIPFSILNYFYSNPYAVLWKTSFLYYTKIPKICVISVTCRSYIK